MSRAPLVITALFLAGAAPFARQAQDTPRTALVEGLARTVYITAVDGKGAAATDLTPAEVVVREDGKVRDVLTVGPATDPMQVVILADDTGPGIQHIREGVASFVRILQNRAEMAIVSTGGRNTLVVDFTTSPDELLTAINRGLVTRSTTGAYLLDGIQESARTLVRREAARPAIVVLTLEGPEYSNVQKSQVLEAVRQSGAILLGRQTDAEDDDFLEPEADRFDPRGPGRGHDPQRLHGRGAPDVRRPARAGRGVHRHRVPDVRDCL
jgi:hypothetical protein